MKTRFVMLLSVLALVAGVAFADDFEDTIATFKNAGQSAGFFDMSYGYAVFPTIAKGGLGVGAARGKGRVFRMGTYVGDTTVTQASFGLQAGGQAYSQIIFFKDEQAFRDFTSGKFSLSGDVGAVAIRTSANASLGSQGAQAGASSTQQSAATAGAYHNGMAVFTVAKGGLMAEAVVAGQRFSFTPNKVAEK